MSKYAALIVSRMGKPKDAGADAAPDEPEADDSKAGQESAAQDILDAVKAGDPKALTDALGNFLDMYEPPADADADEDSQ